MVFYLGELGGCLDAQGKLVEESTVYNAFGGKYEYDSSIQHVDETVLYIPIIPKQWGHFLIDTVSRLWIFLDNRFDVKDTKIYVNIWGFSENKITGNYKKFLEYLGIFGKIKIVDHPIQASEVWIPTYTMSFAKTYNLEYKTVLEYVTKQIMESDKVTHLQHYDYIYLSRTKLPTSKMKEIGEIDIERFLEDNGFKILYPEELSLEEQVFYFQTSKIVAGMSGTIMHNIGFARKETKLCIMNRTCMLNAPQLLLNKLFENEVYIVDAYVESTTKHPRDYGTGPFWLEVNDNVIRFLEDNGFKKRQVIHTTPQNRLKYSISLLYFNLKYNKFTIFIYYNLMKLKNK